MAGGGNLGAAATNTGPSLSGNMGAGMGGMGLGSISSGPQSMAGYDSSVNTYSGPVQTNNAATMQQQFNQMGNALRGNASSTNVPDWLQQQTPQTMPPPPAQTPSANDTITSYYQNILQRAPDQAGIDYWNKQAQGGMSLDDIKQNFLKSPEYMGSTADQQGYAKYLQSLSAPQQTTMAPQQTAAPQQPAPPAWKPTTAGVGNQPQVPVFNNNPAVTQSGGAGSGGAMNFQYRRGGIASLIRR